MAPGNSDHKDDITLYKEIYNRERDRRFVLDNAISQPVTVCTILAALLYFLYKDITPADHSIAKQISLFLIYPAFIVFLFALFFLSWSYNNIFIGFKYEELPSPVEIQKHKEDLAAFNITQEASQQKSFDDYLLRNFVKCSGSYTKINDRRSLHLYYAKTAMISALFLTIAGIVLFIIKSKS